MSTRTATPIVTPPRRLWALQILPAAMLFAGLILGGTGLTEDVSSRLAVPNKCEHPEECIVINTGENSGNNPLNGGYDFSSSL